LLSSFVVSVDYAVDILGASQIPMEIISAFYKKGWISVYQQAIVMGMWQGREMQKRNGKRSST